jgi:hypothetical protein
MRKASFPSEQQQQQQQYTDENDDQETLNITNNNFNSTNNSLAVSNEAYSRVNNILKQYPAAQAANNDIYFQEVSPSDLTGQTNLTSNENTTLRSKLNNPDQQQLQQREAEPREEFYFSSKIRNSGFWGKVRLRRGTWLVIAGLILMIIGIVLVAVFWNWWYGHAVNYPCRVVAITVLSLGVSSFLIGLGTNFAMQAEPLTKHFIGAPAVRWTSWVLLASIAMLVIASDFITVYYTYWHNRWVNTPLIIIAIIFYFFGGLAFIYTLYTNINFMNVVIAKANGTYTPKVKKVKKRPIYMDEATAGYLDNMFVHVGQEETADTAAVLVPVDLEQSVALDKAILVVDEKDPNAKKKDFRKKGLRLQPRANYLQENLDAD